MEFKNLEKSNEVKENKALEKVQELPNQLGEDYGVNELPDELTNEEKVNLKESDLKNTITEYFDDLKSKSEYPETIPTQPFGASGLEKLSPEEVSEKRNEFDDIKAELKEHWANLNHCPWPTYEQDVYSTNGKLIRKAGNDFDAHHIQPLGMGGKNEVSNITPLRAEIHYDKQGIHSPDSPYSKLDKLLEGN